MGLIGLLRLGLIVLAVWLLYRGVKSIMQGAQARSRLAREAREAQRQRGEVLDVMVQDPHCGTYVPQSEALRLRHRGQDLYFCSKQCRDAFLADPDKFI